MLHALAYRFKASRFSGFRDQRGAIAPAMALMIIPIAGAAAMATELGQFYYLQRALQNAADSAALAAAINNSTTGSTYLSEARAAAQKYNFVNGTNNVTVNAAANVTCPKGVPTGSTCYSATLTAQVPLALSALVGFSGDKKNGLAQTIYASAIALTTGTGAAAPCIWTKGSGDSFTSNGGPKPDLAGCSILSNGNATCNGHDLGADYGIAVGTVKGCGKQQVPGATAPTDTYDALKKNIPTNPCTSYAVAPASIILPSTTTTLPTTQCGDVKLDGDVTLTGSNTMTIYNGTLDLNGHKLQTGSGASATLIFSGNDTPNSTVRAPSNSGTLSIKAPDTSTSPWEGVAIYQDPRMGPPHANLDVDYSGNQPTWNITGLVYLPNSNVTFSGAVSKAAYGASCFMLVAYTLLINGTGNIFADNTECSTAGLTQPTVLVPTPAKLVK